MSPRAPLLLLIDLQEGFRDAAYWGPRNNPDAEDNAARLLDAWRRRDLPLIHVRHASVLSESPFVPHKPGHAFMAAVAPRPGEVEIVKSVNSAFIGTDLETRLETLDRPPLVVAGATTDHCVSTTVRMAANLGFAVVLAGDACFAFDRETADHQTIPAEMVHQANLASLHGEFADVRPTATIIADLGVCVQPRPR